MSVAELVCLPTQNARNHRGRVASGMKNGDLISTAPASASSENTEEDQYPLPRMSRLSKNDWKRLRLTSTEIPHRLCKETQHFPPRRLVVSGDHVAFVLHQRHSPRLGRSRLTPCATRFRVLLAQSGKSNFDNNGTKTPPETIFTMFVPPVRIVLKGVILLGLRISSSGLSEIPANSLHAPEVQQRQEEKRIIEKEKSEKRYFYLKVVKPEPSMLYKKTFWKSFGQDAICAVRPHVAFTRVHMTLFPSEA